MFALTRWLRLLGAIGSTPDDSDEERLQRTLLVASTLMIASLAVLWGALYVAYAEWLAASIPLAYAAASFLSLALLAIARRYRLFRASQLAGCGCRGLRRT